MERVVVSWIDEVDGWDLGDAVTEWCDGVAILEDTCLHCFSDVALIVENASHTSGTEPSLLCHFNSWLMFLLTKDVDNQFHVCH